MCIKNSSIYLSVFLMDSISKALYIKMPWDIQSKAKPPKNSQHFWGSRTSPLDEVMTSKHQLSLCKPESEVCSGSRYLLGIIMWVARDFFLLFIFFFNFHVSKIWDAGVFSDERPIFWHLEVEQSCCK